LDWSEIEDWKQYHDEEMWGGSRDDQRAAANRMLDKGIDCITGIPPNWNYPYFDEKHDPEALYRLLRKQAAERKKKDGRGDSSGS